MQKIKILELFYKEKNYSKIKELLKEDSDSWSFNMLAKVAILEIEPDKAFEYFNKAGNILGCAYSKFLQGDLDEARIFLTLIKDTSPAADWLLGLIEILCDNYRTEFTYFQIRNFYEEDLEMLFLYNQTKLAEEIIKRNKFFETYNKEIYKYSARVLFNNKYYKQSKILLKKSLDIFYKDPETHYLLGEIYELEGDIEQAKKSYKKSSEVTGDYAPAKQKINYLSN